MAWLGAQVVPPRAGVQQHRAVARLVGKGQRGPVIGQKNDELDALGQKLVQLGPRGVGAGDDLDGLEVLPHEAAGRVVVLDRQARARESLILDRQVETRDGGQSFLVNAQDGSPDQLHLGLGLLGQCGPGQCRGTNQKSYDSLEHFTSPLDHVGMRPALRQDGFCSRGGREDLDQS